MNWLQEPNNDNNKANCGAHACGSRNSCRADACGFRICLTKFCILDY